MLLSHKWWGSALSKLLTRSLFASPQRTLLASVALRYVRDQNWWPSFNTWTSSALCKKCNVRALSCQILQIILFHHFLPPLIRVIQCIIDETEEHVYQCCSMIVQFVMFLSKFSCNLLAGCCGSTVGIYVSDKKSMPCKTLSAYLPDGDIVIDSDQICKLLMNLWLLIVLSHVPTL